MINRNFQEIVIVHADSLALLGASPSAGTVMANIMSCQNQHHILCDISKGIQYIFFW